MTIRNLILRQTYNDSIVLMQYTVELEMLPGVEKAAIMMATPSTLQFLEENGLLAEDIKDVASDDMLLAVTGNDAHVLDMALETIAQKLRDNDLKQASGSLPIAESKKVEEGILWREVPTIANLALISVPGHYAAAEAWRALKSNRNVMLFSNNVNLEDEVALKRSARERGLLVMGPDCGTAIINGIPLGFANRVRCGNIGIVAAAGSGLQALTYLIDQQGGGITQAIGTGGRDLKKEVDGITTRTALKMLAEDDATHVIVILSKPPDPGIAKEILVEAKKMAKPVVMCLLGMHWKNSIDGNVNFASTILSAASQAVLLSNGKAIPEGQAGHLKELKLAGEPHGFICGFYSGGTLAYEANLLLQSALGEVYSNIPQDEKFRTDTDHLGAKQHIILDLGTEEFTTGRPHPMMDGRWRSELIILSGRHKHTRVVLLDIILGLGADEDPVGSVISAIRSAQKTASEDGRKLTFIAFIVGTDQDPQGLSAQRKKLQDAGVLIADTNEMAVQMALRQLAEESK